MDNAYDDASTFLDNDDVPLGEFLDEQIARVIQHDVESGDELETETPETLARASLPRYELRKVLEGYVMNEETTRDILACKDRDLEKLLCKYKEKLVDPLHQMAQRHAKSMYVMKKISMVESLLI